MAKYRVIIMLKGEIEKILQLYHVENRLHLDK